MSRALSKTWMIIWFVVSEEAQSGKQKNHSAAAPSSAWHIFICFLIKNLLGKMRHCSTHSSSVELCDCCRKKLDLILFFINRAEVKWTWYSF